MPFTAVVVVVVPSSSATSAARQRSTSRRISTARCRGGRYCKAAIKASRMLCRDATISAGSADPALTSASGMGCNHGISGRAAASGGSGYSPCPATPDPAPPGAGRQWPAAAVPQRAQAGFGRDPVQPGPQRRPPLEFTVGPPGPDHGLLHLVFGIVDRAQHAVAVRQQLRPERVGETREILAGGHGCCSLRASRAAPSLV